MIPNDLVIAIKLLRGSRRAAGAAGKIVREVLPLLEKAEQELRKLGTPIRRESQRSGMSVEYAVESTVGGEMLTERRGSGRSSPFRCSKNIYEAVLKAISAAQRPLAIDEIMAVANQTLGAAAADFQIRVPIRLWLHANPPLIRRHRARYQPVDAQNFSDSAIRLWRQLKSLGQ